LSGRTLGTFSPAGPAPAPASTSLARPPLLPWRCVLAVTDLSPAGTNAAWRAALVARDRGVPLQLVNVQPDARSLSAVERMLQELAQHLQQRLHVTVSATAVAGELRAQLAECAAGAALLVLPWSRGNPLLDAVFGSAAERVFRAVSLPLLLVKRPAFTSYRRVLVPVKLDAGAALLIAAARSMSRDPRMRVFHVLDTGSEGSLRIADASERVVRLHRQRRSRSAYSALNDLITHTGAHEQGAAALVSFGHVPARVLEIARAGNAQLIVAGKERRSALAGFICGGVTQRLLAEADADVLVLPVEQGSRSAERSDFHVQWPVA
jgi:nucleotide-binding universal stress UspA family protein